ncbi:MAG: Stk1 family PASTA domain-containing Ser/Thr kinase, partial [Firmicutes bacterium]|nr:Stk1 family PASTA domain-containing Ser/Thr kinase [Bacillota bacterium]
MNLLGVVLGGRYEILEKLGAGGMAVVYRAVDTLLQRPVTVKVLRSELAGDEAVVKRFRREAQSAASLSHPNVVGVYDVGRQDDVHYIVMEYVEGKSLKDIIAERGPLPAEEALRIARQICEALRHAHGHHIIHRDVKPHNVLITPEGRAKVTDFGIAGAATTSTVTYPGVLLGTVYYFSPEQAQGKYGDERSDLYALGVVLYEMLTGRVPFEGESPVSVALKQIREEPRPLRELNPRVPPAAERVVLRAMAKAPELRYQSAAEMLKDLDALQRQLAEWRSGRAVPRGQPGLADRTQVVGEAPTGRAAGPTPPEGRPRTGTQPGLRDYEPVGEELRADE